MTTSQKDQNMKKQNADMFSLSLNPNKAGQEMVDTINAIQKIFELENEALEKADTKAFLSLQDDKLAIARLYQGRVREMLSRKDDMKNMSSDLKNKLAKMQVEFTKLAQTNSELLGRMQNSMERLGNAIRRAAKQTAREMNTYNYDARGSLSHGEKKSVSTGISETA